MTDVDLTKVLLDSRKSAFKNNNIYTGTLSVSGSWTSGYNEKRYDITLDEAPDMVGAIFNGPTDTVFGSDPRPSNGWFKDGYIWVLGQNAGAGYTDYPIPFKPYMIITSSTTATIILTSISQIAPTLTLNSTDFSYRIVDYSVL